MSYEATLIPGDGIGPEVTEAARREDVYAGVEFDYGSPVTDSLVQWVERHTNLDLSVAAKGPALHRAPGGGGVALLSRAIRTMWASRSS